MRAMLYIAFILLPLCTVPAEAQITEVATDGKRVFVNAEENGFVRKPRAKRNATLWARGTPGTYSSQSIPKEWLERLVQETANRHRVDPALVKAVVEAESAWNPAAISRKGAVGLMQLMPGKAESLGVKNAFDPEENLDGGVRHLRTLLERYNGDLHLSLAAYNAGEGAVARSRGVPNYRETRSYVQKITDSYFRPDSGRQPRAFDAPRPIYRVVDERGRVVYTNE